jgi:hypothetical protein
MIDILYGLLRILGFFIFLFGALLWIGVIIVIIKGLLQEENNEK